MIYIAYQLQTFFLLTILMIAISKLPTTTENVINTFMTVAVFVFHASLRFLQIDPFLYVWFWMSLLHFWIHAYKAKYTIVETRKATPDEIWHICNQMMAFYYLNYYSHAPTQLIHFYGGCMVTYLIALAFLYSGDTKAATPEYYLGSIMEALFIVALDKVEWITILLLASHLYITWLVTFKNDIGRIFMKADIAGCAFISEFITVYLIYNKFY